MTYKEIEDKRPLNDPDVAAKGVHDGWGKLVRPLVVLCNAYDVTVVQVKEKFGTLRFYVGAAPEELLAVIDSVEMKSAHVCEYCGEDGWRYDEEKKKTVSIAYTAPLYDRGWILTLCPKCRDAKKEKERGFDEEQV